MIHQDDKATPGLNYAFIANFVQSCETTGLKALDIILT